MNEVNQQNNLGFTEDIDREWEIARIIKHDSKRKRVMVEWKIGGKGWYDQHLVALQEPLVMVKYATKHPHMRTEEGWEWTQEFIQQLKKFKQSVYAYRTVRTHKPKYKFGIEVPRSPKHALQLDTANGNGLFQEAIDKELKAIHEHKTFRIPDPGEDLSEYKWIPYHFVFDVKFDLRRKTRLVAGGNKTDDPGPDQDVYSGVVGIEFVRLLFLLASMNDLKVYAADVGNAFLHGKN